METNSLKALALKVLQRNLRGNLKETEEEKEGNCQETIITNTEFLVDVTSWLEKLSDSEREIFEERAAIMEYDGKIKREQAEVEAIRRIIQERIIKGKCDKCERVEGCMLTRGHRPLCEGPY